MSRFVWRRSPSLHSRSSASSMWKFSRGRDCGQWGMNVRYFTEVSSSVGGYTVVTNYAGSQTASMIAAKAEAEKQAAIEAEEAARESMLAAQKSDEPPPHSAAAVAAAPGDWKLDAPTLAHFVPLSEQLTRPDDRRFVNSWRAQRSLDLAPELSSWISDGSPPVLPRRGITIRDAAQAAVKESRMNLKKWREEEEAALSESERNEMFRRKEKEALVAAALANRPVTFSNPPRRGSATASSKSPITTPPTIPVATISSPTVPEEETPLNPVVNLSPGMAVQVNRPSNIDNTSNSTPRSYEISHRSDYRDTLVLQASANQRFFSAWQSTPLPNGRLRACFDELQSFSAKLKRRIAESQEKRTIQDMLAEGKTEEEAVSIGKLARDQLESGPQNVILDVGCGRGLSTMLLALQNPDILVIGIDRTNKIDFYDSHRLKTHRPSSLELSDEDDCVQLCPEDVNGGQNDRRRLVSGTPVPSQEDIDITLPNELDTMPENVFFIRAEMFDVYRWLIQHSSEWKVQKQYFLHPTPHEGNSTSSMRKRLYGSHLLPAVLNLGGELIVRSNWFDYVDQLRLALQYHALCHRWMMRRNRNNTTDSSLITPEPLALKGDGTFVENLSTFLSSSEPQIFDVHPKVPLSHFEHKYLSTKQPIYELRVKMNSPLAYKKRVMNGQGSPDFDFAITAHFPSKLF